MARYILFMMSIIELAASHKKTDFHSESSYSSHTFHYFLSPIRTVFKISCFCGVFPMNDFIRQTKRLHSELYQTTFSPVHHSFGLFLKVSFALSLRLEDTVMGIVHLSGFVYGLTCRQTWKQTSFSES